MGYFESLDSSLKLEPTPIGVSFSTLTYSHDSFLDNLKNGVFSPTKIKSIIENNIQLYFDYTGFSDAKTRTNMQSIWTNIYFLNNVLALLNESQKFRQNVVSKYLRDVNIIAADYISNDSKAMQDDHHSPIVKDSSVANLLFEIASNLNAEYIVQLSSNVKVDFAKMICIANFSTFDTRVSAHNLVSQIWTYAKYGEVLSIEQIIYIFYVFNKDNFSELFIMLMRIRCKDDETEEVKQVDDNISSALINILNSMSSVEVKEVLAKYSNYISFLHDPDLPLRFSLRHLPAEFSNIADCVKSADNNGYYIP